MPIAAPQIDLPPIRTNQQPFAIPMNFAPGGEAQPGVGVVGAQAFRVHSLGPSAGAAWASRIQEIQDEQAAREENRRLAELERWAVIQQTRAEIAQRNAQVDRAKNNINSALRFVNQRRVRSQLAKLREAGIDTPESVASVLANNPGAFGTQTAPMINAMTRAYDANAALSGPATPTVGTIDNPVTHQPMVYRQTGPRTFSFAPAKTPTQALSQTLLKQQLSQIAADRRIAAGRAAKIQDEINGTGFYKPTEQRKIEMRATLARYHNDVRALDEQARNLIEQANSGGQSAGSQLAPDQEAGAKRAAAPGYTIGAVYKLADRKLKYLGGDPWLESSWEDQ